MSPIDFSVSEILALASIFGLISFLILKIKKAKLSWKNSLIAFTVAIILTGLSLKISQGFHGSQELFGWPHEFYAQDLSRTFGHVFEGSYGSWIWSNVLFYYSGVIVLISLVKGFKNKQLPS